MSTRTLQSAEVRWFFDENDSRVASLKTRFGHVKPQGARRDQYAQRAGACVRVLAENGVSADVANGALVELGR
jgi:hypothetical protein